MLRSLTSRVKVAAVMLEVGRCGRSKHSCQLSDSVTVVGGESRVDPGDRTAPTSATSGHGSTVSARYSTCTALDFRSSNPQPTWFLHLASRVRERLLFLGLCNAPCPRFEQELRQTSIHSRPLRPRTPCLACHRRTTTAMIPPDFAQGCSHLDVEPLNPKEKKVKLCWLRVVMMRTI